MTLKTISVIPLRSMTAKSKYFISGLFLALLTGLLFHSCQKNNNVNISYHRGIESGTNYVFAQQMMTQIMATYFKTLTDSTFLADGFNVIDGASVYDRTDQSPQRISFEYPYWSVPDGYGHRRAGTIDAITETGFYENEAVIELSFTEFFYDYDSVTVDSMYLTNLGRTDGKNLSYQVKAAEIKYVFIDTSGIFRFNIDEIFTTFKSNVSPYTSPYDSLGVSGLLNGNTADDVGFMANNPADSSSLFSYQCNYLKQGITGIETEQFDYLTIVRFQSVDSCNNGYLIEIDGNPFPQRIDPLAY